MATAHLAQLGHRYIGFLGWPGPSWVGNDRYQGWHDELAERRLDHGESLVAESINDRTRPRPRTESLLAQHPDITAIVAVSDELAVGAQVAAQRPADRSASSATTTARSPRSAMG